MLPFFKLPAFKFKSFAGLVLISSISFKNPKFFSLIKFSVRGNKLSNPIEPGEAISNGSLLLSVSWGEWSDVIHVITLFKIPLLT